MMCLHQFRIGGFSSFSNSPIPSYFRFRNNLKRSEPSLLIVSFVYFLVKNTQPNYGPFKFDQPSREILMSACLSSTIQSFYSYSAELANSKAHSIITKQLRMALRKWFLKKLLTFFQAKNLWDSLS